MMARMAEQDMTPISSSTLKIAVQIDMQSHYIHLSLIPLAALTHMTIKWQKSK
jgi:hypothetical protein